MQSVECLPVPHLRLLLELRRVGRWAQICCLDLLVRVVRELLRVDLLDTLGVEEGRVQVFTPLILIGVRSLLLAWLDVLFFDEEREVDGVDGQLLLLVHFLRFTHFIKYNFYNITVVDVGIMD